MLALTEAPPAFVTRRRTGLHYPGYTNGEFLRTTKDQMLIFHMMEEISSQENFPVHKVALYVTNEVWEL